MRITDLFKTPKTSVEILKEAKEMIARTAKTAEALQQSPTSELIQNLSAYGSDIAGTQLEMAAITAEDDFDPDEIEIINLVKELFELEVNQYNLIAAEVDKRIPNPNT